MQRIGILGGTFNPIHVGHLAMAEMAREKFSLHKIIFIPSHTPPHKKIYHLASAQDRYEMVRCAIQSHPDFEVSDLEIKREGKSYTVDTVKQLMAMFPKGSKLFFIVGGDSIEELHTWKNIEEIQRRATFIAVNRPGHDTHQAKIKHLSVTMPGIDISSSYVRQRLQEGKTVKYFVPNAVLEYIEKHRLYQ
ncbi:MAG: nicotinate-nucleotide adenylyltransferase [Candidatus Omnitrophica bacterium]|nr:nicotinate-nucleotide adenylyltransferase [Candidatus Omnitrophota bacterium]